jgi:hypothetical protein
MPDVSGILLILRLEALPAAQAFAPVRSAPCNREQRSHVSGFDRSLLSPDGESHGSRPRMRLHCRFCSPLQMAH